MRTRALGAAAIAVATTIAACGGDDERGAAKPVSAAASPPPRGVVANCSTQSFADFAGAYANPRNVVVGPLSLVGAADTSPATVREFGGNKFPLLVRAGRRVTLELSRRDREGAALAYGPLPQGEIGLEDGHRVVTFVACDRDEAGSTAGARPVTFWSGFVLAASPRCIPLRVWVDGERSPRTVSLRMGERRC